MDEHLTPVEFTGIYNNLYSFSDSWADLWMVLYITGMPVGSVLKLKYTDIHGSYLFLSSGVRLTKKKLRMDARLKKLLELRSRRYPCDIYIFQSHSNRNKLNECPLTLIAFNHVLKIASKKVTNKNVSSKSAYIRGRLCYI